MCVIERDVVFTADVFLNFSFAMPGLCVGVVVGVNA